MSNNLCEGIEHQERSEIGRFCQFELVRSPSSSNQDPRSYPGVLSCLQITDGISHTDGTSKVQMIPFGRLQEETWLRFSTGTDILRGMGTHKGIIHPTAGIVNRLENMVVNLNRSLQRDDASTNGRLIGNQNNFYRGMFQQCQSGQRLWQKGYIFQAADIMGLIFNDNPITVEE